MSTNEINFNDPDFLDRAREVRRAMDAGEPMSMGEIADRLGMDFHVFAQHLAAECFRQFPDLDGVLAEGSLIVQGSVH